MFPSTRPLTITSRASTSAFTTPLGPMVNVPLERFSFPSTCPSTYKSSLPVTSPLIFIPWLIDALERAALVDGVLAAGCVFIFGVATELAIGVTPAGATGAGVASAAPGGLESSLRHIETPQARVFLQVASRLEGGCDS